MQSITLVTALFLPNNCVTQHFIHSNSVHSPSQHGIVITLLCNTHHCLTESSLMSSKQHRWIWGKTVIGLRLLFSVGKSSSLSLACRFTYSFSFSWDSISDDFSVALAILFTDQHLFWKCLHHQGIQGELAITSALTGCEWIVWRSGYLTASTTPTSVK